MLRPVDLQKAPIAELRVLPTNAQPITLWDDRDNAFFNVAKGIRRIVESLLKIEEPEDLSSPPTSLTAGRIFYHRLRTAIEVQDLTLIEALYHSNALQISLSTGHIFRGAEAIINAFKRTFQITGSVKPKSIESFVEVGNIICVEATTINRFAEEEQSYDVFVLQANKVVRHFTGLISPRSQMSQSKEQEGPTTQRRAFYNYLCTAIATQDLAKIEALYHPNAISISSNSGQINKGREAIIASFRAFFGKEAIVDPLRQLFGKEAIVDPLRQLFGKDIIDSFSQLFQATRSQTGGSVKLKSIENFVETEDIICVEGTNRTNFGPNFGGLSLDIQFYDIYIIRANQVLQNFSGLISSRQPVLQHSLQQAIQQQLKIQESIHRMRMHSIENIGQSLD
jgi:hypothetical protein